nr:hypothetical protein [Dactylosporangium roseum]
MSVPRMCGATRSAVGLSMLSLSSVVEAVDEGSLDGRLEVSEVDHDAVGSDGSGDGDFEAIGVAVQAWAISGCQGS